MSIKKQVTESEKTEGKRKVPGFENPVDSHTYSDFFVSLIICHMNTINRGTSPMLNAKYIGSKDWINVLPKKDAFLLSSSCIPHTQCSAGEDDDDDVLHWNMIGMRVESVFVERKRNAIFFLGDR